MECGDPAPPWLRAKRARMDEAAAEPLKLVSPTPKFLDVLIWEES
jgi:hypothetical protein